MRPRSKASPADEMCAPRPRSGRLAPIFAAALVLAVFHGSSTFTQHASSRAATFLAWVASGGGGGTGATGGPRARNVAGRSSLRAAAEGASGRPSDATDDARLVARQDLLDTIATLERGFSATEQDKEAMRAKIDTLASLSPAADPATQLGGDWTLLYTDAPDILGIPSGPFASLGRIGQEIDPAASTITNVIEYVPSPLAAGLAGFASEDELVQRVITEYEVASPTSVDLKISGFGLQPRRVLGVQLPDFARFQARGPLSLPFGKFEILYLDDEIRIVRTYQGWYSVNRRGLSASV